MQAICTVPSSVIIEMIVSYNFRWNIERTHVDPHKGRESESYVVKRFVEIIRNLVCVIPYWTHVNHT